jgi:catechol 2,3-dioxygenase-like lactoylglutathione lyase family enzyme
MTFISPALIPELDVSNLASSLAFYVDVIGFRVAYDRPAEMFAYLVRDDVHMMLEEAEGPGGRFRTAPLEPPFGRGINLQIRVQAIEDLYARVLATGLRLVINLEERWYESDGIEVGHRQFVVQDPDGYLLRFFEHIGSRSVAPG